MTISKRNVVCDIDGVICPIKRSDEDYADLVPYAAVVRKLRQWQQNGYKILLYTSRNMQTHDGNIGLINRQTIPKIVAWLERWDIPCDELYVGKPWPGKEGFYIDDRTIRADEFLSLGEADIEQLIAGSRDKALNINKAAETQLVITMAGLGTRFQKAGYKQPKYMIQALGNTLFYWSLSSLKPFIDAGARLIFIVRAADNSREFIESELKHFNPSRYDIIEIDDVTDGQATTVLFAKSCWQADRPLGIYNIDTFVDPEAVDPFDISGAGWIPCFNAPGEHWSFVRTNENGLAVEVAEKRRISDNATIGFYWFESASLYEKAYKTFYEDLQAADCKERYIAPMYNYLIEQGMPVRIFDIPKENVHALGTPDELHEFCNGYEVHTG